MESWPGPKSLDVCKVSKVKEVEVGVRKWCIWGFGANIKFFGANIKFPLPNIILLDDSLQKL